MNIRNILKKLEGCRNNDNSQIMYRAIEVTLCASEFTNESRLKSYMDLLNLCTKERNEDVLDFTRAVIATDYYFSVGRGLRSVPFLNESLQKYGKLSGVEPPSVDDADRFLGQFRARNLKGKYQREQNAVKTIQILNGAARELKIELSLGELILDEVPSYYIWKGFIPALVAIIGGMMLVLYPFEEYRIARLTGNSMPFWDALQTSEIPCLVIGLSVVVLACIYIFWKGNPTQIKWMSIYSYWRFSVENIKENP